MSLIIQLLVSALVFVVLSKILPGFQIKNFGTAVLVALIYGILMVLSSLLITPLSFISNLCVKLVSWIPIIGSIAGIGAIVFRFILNFVVGSIMLGVTDTFLKGFKMRSFAVGVVASFLISVISCFLPMF